MNLPPRAFFSVNEIAARWGCALADIAGWSHAGHLSMVTGIASVICGKLIVAGMVAVSAADMMQMFRRHGPSSDECRVFRVRPEGSTEWHFITEPPEGLLIKLSDLMLTAEEVQKIEDERDLQRRSASSIGAPSRYDWEAVYIMLICRFNDRGLPATQADLIAEVQDWFTQNSANGEIPEESTTRKKIAPIWRALRETA